MSVDEFFLQILFQDISLADLNKIVAEDLGVSPGSLQFVRSGTGKFNDTYFVEGAGQRLVLRVAPPEDRSRVLFYEHLMMRQEPSLHETILQRTSVPIPSIITHDFSRNRLDRDYLLMERMPGTPISDHSGLSPGSVNRALREVGQALSEVHGIHHARYGYIGEHSPMEPQDDWTSAFVIMWHKLIDDIEGAQGYSAQEASGMRKLLDRHLGVFDRRVESSLLHMDVWAQNILVDGGGGMTCLLDWDRALWGDPEIEFAVLDYCGISEPAFWEGYGQERKKTREAGIRRLFYLLYELQKYIFIRRVRGADPLLADQYRVQSLQLAAQLIPI